MASGSRGAGFGAYINLRRLSQPRQHQAYVEDEVESERGQPAVHRTQVSIDTPEETGVEAMMAEAARTPFSSSRAQTEVGDVRGLGRVSPAGVRSRSSTVSTEPFPDFDPSNVEEPSGTYRAQEEAYEQALSRVASEMHGTGPNQTSLTALHQPVPLFENDSSGIPHRPSVIVLDGVQPCEAETHHDHFCHEHEARKGAAHIQVLDILRLKEDLPAPARSDFTDITAMVIDIEYVLFRANNFPADPLSLLSEDDLKRVRELASLITRLLSGIAKGIKEAKQSADRARNFISRLATESGLPVRRRFERMAKLVIQPYRFLSREHSTEQNLFELFQHFFEVYFYDDFHIIYNNFLVEHQPNVPYRLRHFSLLMNEASDILVAVVADYKELCEIYRQVGNQPAFPELSVEPHTIFDALMDLREPLPGAQWQLRERNPQSHNVPVPQHLGLQTHQQSNTSAATYHTESQTPSQPRAPQGYPRILYPRSPYPQRADLDRSTANSSRTEGRAMASLLSMTENHRPLPSYSSHTVSARSLDPFAGQVQSEEAPLHSQTEYEPTEYMDSFEVAAHFAGAEGNTPVFTNRFQGIRHVDEPPSYDSHAFTTARSQPHNEIGNTARGPERSYANDSFMTAHSQPLDQMNTEEDLQRSRILRQPPSYVNQIRTRNTSTNREEDILPSYSEAAGAQLLHDLDVDASLAQHQRHTEMGLLQSFYPYPCQTNHLVLQSHPSIDPNDIEGDIIDLNPHFRAAIFGRPDTQGSTSTHPIFSSTLPRIRTHGHSNDQSPQSRFTHGHTLALAPRDTRTTSTARMQAFSDFLNTRPRVLHEAAYLPPFPEYGAQSSQQTEIINTTRPQVNSNGNGNGNGNNNNNARPLPPLPTRPTTSRGPSSAQQGHLTIEHAPLLLRPPIRPSTARGQRPRPPSPYPFVFGPGSSSGCGSGNANNGGSGTNHRNSPRR
ncbi:hypothetical protein BJY04DRAFT_222829 [Aspergillus karnatakaensis]|uniref:uncharacterized protein n=1 Tax=Aspergillus karnatakaensis TaxID=1810916 RepID=UPI003CCCAB26